MLWDWLIRCKVPRCFPGQRWDLSLWPSLRLCLSLCLHHQTMTRLISRLPPSLLTGPHKQGHSDCCKRKMYHLLEDGWHDVSTKSFYFDQKYYCNPPAVFPPPSNWTRRQTTTATCAAKEIASSVPRKIHKSLLKMGVFVQQPAVRGLETDWRWASLITYLASGAKGSEPPPLSAMKFLFSSIILHMYFNRLQKVVRGPDSTEGNILSFYCGCMVFLIFLQHKQCDLFGQDWNISTTAGCSYC